MTRGMMLLGVPLFALSAARSSDISFLAVRLVDYHDQLELPAPNTAGIEDLIGRKQAEQMASIVSPQESSERPHRPLLRVEFRASVNLGAVANRSATVFLHSYFCSHQNDFAMLSAPTVYANGKPIRAEVRKSEDASSGNTGKEFIYYFYLNAFRKEKLNARPPQTGFDLRAVPENVCFYVTGSGESGLIYTSSVGTVPREAIEAAFR